MSTKVACGRDLEYTLSPCATLVLVNEHTVASEVSASYLTEIFEISFVTGFLQNGPSLLGELVRNMVQIKTTVFLAVHSLVTFTSC